MPPEENLCAITSSCSQIYYAQGNRVYKLKHRLLYISYQFSRNRHWLQQRIIKFDSNIEDMCCQFDPRCIVLLKHGFKDIPYFVIAGKLVADSLTIHVGVAVQLWWNIHNVCHVMSQHGYKLRYIDMFQITTGQSINILQSDFTIFVVIKRLVLYWEETRVNMGKTSKQKRAGITTPKLKGMYSVAEQLSA